MNTLDKTEEIKNHRIVSEDEWTKARLELLKKEKEWTRAKDDLSKQRRELPWVKVEKNYVFEGPEGNVSLGDLFGTNSQLIVYHFMYAPSWDEGCDGCSFLCDHVDGARPHIENHDVSFVAVSRAPSPKLEAYKERMGWGFKWVSSLDSDFNYDFHVSYTREQLDKGPVFHNFITQKLSSEEQPGISVFYRDENGDVFHTYSSYERGGDILIGAYNFLDLTPKGRNESHTMEWMRRHDEYAAHVS